MVPVQSSEQSSSEDVAAARSVNAGYKLVFDNIDKNVKPRHMRSDNHCTTCNHMHRVNYDSISNEQSTEVNVFDILPAEEDYKSLKMNIAILVSRVIVKLFPFFTSDYKGLPIKHIPHEHSSEMARKSEIHSDRSYCLLIHYTMQ